MKSHSLFGPLNMGLCRAVNLLLGISVGPALTGRMAWLGLFPLVFITAVTVISRGEVLGGSKKALKTSFIMYLALTAGLILLGIWQNAAPRTLLFAGYWLVMAAWPLKNALERTSVV